jgi:hypothetical protein
MKLIAAVLFTLGLFAGVCFAQEKTAPRNEEQILAAQLADKDYAVRQSAIEAIRDEAAHSPDGAAAALRRSWLAPMAKAGFNDDIVQMTQTAILASPGSQLELEPMLRARVYALIALGRKDEALADARRLYNVCTLDQTGIAVDLLALAMKAKFGDSGEAGIRQFRMRQITTAAATKEPTTSPVASALPTTAPAGNSIEADIAQSPDPSDQMILSIKVDDAPYISEATKWKANHRQPVAYGNLLLMAGHAVEAYAYFTDLLNAARTDKDLAIALERQSAAMRAQDGNPARAQGRLRRLSGDGT